MVIDSTTGTLYIAHLLTLFMCYDVIHDGVEQTITDCRRDVNIVDLFHRPCLRYQLQSVCRTCMRYCNNET